MPDRVRDAQDFDFIEEKVNKLISPTVSFAKQSPIALSGTVGSEFVTHITPLM
jgi:hypothetical protein